MERFSISTLQSNAISVEETKVATPKYHQSNSGSFGGRSVRGELNVAVEVVPIHIFGAMTLCKSASESPKFAGRQCPSQGMSGRSKSSPMGSFWFGFEAGE
jgi:hypothetical protein